MAEPFNSAAPLLLQGCRVYETTSHSTDVATILNHATLRTAPTPLDPPPPSCTLKPDPHRPRSRDLAAIGPHLAPQTQIPVGDCFRQPTFEAREGKPFLERRSVFSREEAFSRERKRFLERRSVFSRVEAVGDCFRPPTSEAWHPWKANGQ